MIALNDAQAWALIGLFATSTFAMVGLTSTMFLRVLRAEIGRVETKIDHLDRDVQAITKRVFGDS